MKDISVERVLEISNNWSEGIKDGSKEEWIQVALYFRHEHDKALQKYHAFVDTIMLAALSERSQEPRTCTPK